MDPVHCSADSEGEAKHRDADGSEEAARAPGPGSYEHQPAGQLNAANCAAQQHNRLRYVRRADRDRFPRRLIIGERTGGAIFSVDEGEPGQVDVVGEVLVVDKKVCKIPVRRCWHNCCLP